MSAPPSWNDLQVGAAPPAYVDGPMTLTDIVRYQGASGDLNPLHHDPGYAQAAGYSGPFAVGMRQAGVLAAQAGRWLGHANVRRFRVRFQEQAWPGDVLVYEMRVTGKREEGGERLVDLELTCTRQGGGVHLRGTATYAVPDRSGA
ncbi:Acyl dehydratase [Pseudonocardia thermophila]|jgi:Acyl dehydratase|uniref:Acyl dehydratase n=1 Tax=Pseudonocardia thermophila TaxID=1848 RepID=A0A1M6UYF6_PSETH|nr:MaoC family dehydratase [Pseudonocardia thermophila]SHK74161.1 Acyl dehydratase [Pseudonocardia thermophila]